MWACILAAAGSGSRLGYKIPKALVPIQDIPMWKIPAQTIIESPFQHRIITAPNDYLAQFNHPDFHTLSGGKERQDSIYLALEYLANQAQPPKYVLIHDAARPFLSAKTIATIQDFVEQYQRGAICGIPARDTMKEVNGHDQILATPNRERLRSAQTPQAFPFKELWQYHQQAREQNISVTDDAALCELNGLPVHIVPGSPLLFKITDKDDLWLAQSIYPSVLDKV